MSTGSGEVDANTAPKGSQKDSRTARLKHLERFKAEHPLSPDAQVDPKAAEMVQYYLQARKDHDFKLVDSIRRNKEFGNPYILTKVVEHFKIEQSGSNFPKEIFDPNELTAADFEESVKRRRVDTAGTAGIDAGQQAGPVPVPSAAAIAASAAAAAGQAAGGPTSSAAALAAAVAAITSSMGGTVAATAAAPGSEKEPQRKSKWG